MVYTHKHRNNIHAEKSETLWIRLNIMVTGEIQ